MKCMLLWSVTPFLRSQYAGHTNNKQTDKQTDKQTNTGVVYYIASSLLLMNDAESQFSSFVLITAKCRNALCFENALL